MKNFLMSLLIIFLLNINLYADKVKYVFISVNFFGVLALHNFIFLKKFIFLLKFRIK